MLDIPMPPRLRTPAQRAASRANGAQSHGPITPSGRRSSSRNATKHGLSGAGKSLPPDMEHELLEEIALFRSQFHPTSEYEHTLIRRAALGSLRSRRIADSLNALADERARNAIPAWDNARADQIAQLASSLFTNPARSTRLLRQTTEGCDHLADSWESLANILQSRGALTYDQCRHALALLGAPDLRSPSPDTDLGLFALCAYSLLTPSDARDHLPSLLPLDPNRQSLLPANEARATLLDFIQTEIEALESQAAVLWETQDRPSRQSAPARAAFEGTPETARLERYLASADRMRRLALEELHNLRKNPTAEPPSQNEPTAAPTPEPSAPQNEPEPTRHPRTSSPFPPLPTPISAPPAPSLNPSPEQTPPTTLTS